MIAYLFDQCLPRGLVSDCAECGIDAAHVWDLGLSQASDREILDAARAMDRVVVTFDSDFGTLLALSGSNRPSVIHIRWRRPGRAEMLDLLASRLADYEPDLAAGSILSISRQGLRVRRLPLLLGP